MSDKFENKKEEYHGFEKLDDFKNAKKRFFIAISIVFVSLLLYFPNLYLVLSVSSQISVIKKNIAASSKSWIAERGDVAVKTIQEYNKCVDGVGMRGVELSRDDCLKSAGEEFYKIVKDAVEKSDVSEDVKYLYIAKSD